MERYPPILEKLTAQISTLLERYMLQQEEIRRLEGERNALLQAIEEKSTENKALYNEMSHKEQELENISERIRAILGEGSESGGNITPAY